MKKFLLLFLIFCLFGGGILFFWPFFHLEEIKIIVPGIISMAEKEIFSPPPLKLEDKKENPQVILNSQEVIKWTNIQRGKYGLPPLEENATLNAMAQAKAEDMFKYQYFAHKSLLSEEVGDLAKNFNYEFITIGENLAMGNFESDEKLVIAWMESPGHRENILNKSYLEIGVAVQKGVFNGNSVWMAVQHFGLPQTACPQPSESVKIEIEEKEQELQALEKILLSTRSDLQKIRPKWGSYYQEKLEEYNKLVEKYNNLIEENKILISKYNMQVQEFNQCIAELK